MRCTRLAGPHPRPLAHTTPTSCTRRARVISAGEGRSANRSKWAADDAASAPPALQQCTSAEAAAGDGVQDGSSFPVATTFTDTISSSTGQLQSNTVAAAGAAAPLAAASHPKLPPEQVVWEGVEAVGPLFESIDRLVYSNVKRVQAAFRAARIGPHHFAGSTGYGHGDLGREALDQVGREGLWVFAVGFVLFYGDLLLPHGGRGP